MQHGSSGSPSTSKTTTPYFRALLKPQYCSTRQRERPSNLYSCKQDSLQRLYRSDPAASSICKLQQQPRTSTNRHRSKNGTTKAKAKHASARATASAAKAGTGNQTNQPVGWTRKTFQPTTSTELKERKDNMQQLFATDVDSQDTCQAMQSFGTATLATSTPMTRQP